MMHHYLIPSATKKMSELTTIRSCNAGNNSDGKSFKATKSRRSRRRSRIHYRCISRTTAAARTSIVSLASFLLAALFIFPSTTNNIHVVQAGLSIGKPIVVNSCYNALQSAQRPDSNVVDKDGYARFINELSGNAFEALQKDEESGTWGYYPVTTFDQLPASIRGEFYLHACGGEFVICENAYLYTDGTGGVRADDQQVVYLFQVCLGVEEAIEAAMPKNPTPEPTPSPTTGAVATPVPTRQPVLPPCPPMYNNGSYLAGDLVSTAREGALSSFDNKEYSYYQCKPAPYSGWCAQAAYAPGQFSTNWNQAWTLLGRCDGDAIPPPTPPPTFRLQPTYTPTLRPTFARPATGSPTDVVATEPPGPMFSGEVPLQLTYHAAVSMDVSTEELQSIESDVRLNLLGAMNTWAFRSTSNYADWKESGGSTAAIATTGKVRRRRLRNNQRERELVVMPNPMVETVGQEYMDVIDVLCSSTITIPIQSNDHCIQVTTNLTLLFEDEPVDSERQALAFFDEHFNEEILDGSFHESLRPLETRNQFRELYPVPTNEDFTFPPPTSILVQKPAEPKNTSNTAGIASGVVVGLVCFSLLAFFVYRRRKYRDDDYSFSETSSKKKEFDPAGDLEVGAATRGAFGDGDSHSSSSSRDEFSSSSSQSSHSMESYSGDEDSRSSRSSASTNSRSSYGSRRSRGSRSSSGSGSYYSSSHTSRDSRNSGAASVSNSETDSYSNGNVSPYTSGTKDGIASTPPDDDAILAAAAVPKLGRKTSQDSESTAGSRSSATGGLYSSENRSSASSSVGEASDPTGMMEQDEHSSTTGDDSASGGDGSNSYGNSHGSYSKGSNSLGRSAASSYEGDGDGSSSGGGTDPFKTNIDILGDDQPQDVHSSRSSSQNTGGVHSSRSSSKTSRGTTTADDDSSAGSSGWDSSDGDSSVDTGSVDSYDPTTINTGDLASSTEGGGSSSFPGSSTTGDSMTLEEQYKMNPAVNPVVQPGVTMLPIVAEGENENSTHVTPTSDGSPASNGSNGRRHDEAPLGGDIQEAIEKGDWVAVGATAAILASDSSSDGNSSTLDDNATRDDATRDSTSNPSGGSGMMSVDSEAVSEDDVRAAEIDQLVESGNWDGVVAVAARYADEADEADDQLGRLPTKREETTAGSNQGSSTGIPSSKSGSGNSSSLTAPSVVGSRDGSGGSVSVETADASSVYSNTTREDSMMSHSTYSDQTYTSMDDTTVEDGASTISDSHTPPDSSNTHSSSITSDYVSGSGGAITSSMVSAVSTVDQQDKQQMILYRAEVEALVRRVVPDEIDNVDDIMVQFSGREEELIETLRSMQEKSIAQRARAAVQRSAKKEAGRTGSTRDFNDESSEDLGQSVTTDGGQSMTTDGGQTIGTDVRSGYTESVSSRGSRTRGDSNTEQHSRDDDNDSYSSSGYSRSDSGRSSVSSYSSGSSRAGSSRSDASGTEYSESQMGHSLGIISVTKSVGSDIDIVKTSPGLADAIDASDWRAVGDVSDQLQGDGKSSSQPSGMTSMSKDTCDELDDMIDDGNWSGIIDAASNMRGGHELRSDSDIGSGDDDLD